MLAFSSILFASCVTVVFTTKPDLGERHHGKIPAQWQGYWEGENNTFFKISADSVQYGGSPFSYSIADSLKGQFIYFKENYCFVVQCDTPNTIYTVTMARINSKSEIECFDMDYGYFLKNQLITSVRAKQYFYVDADSTAINAKLLTRNVKIDLPAKSIIRTKENSNKLDYELIIKDDTYEKYLRNITLEPYSSPLYTSYKYDFAFFKQYSSNVKPTLILHENKKMSSNDRSLLEKKYDRLFKKDAKHDLNRLLKTEL
jgi:hypothetical protein